PRRRRIRRWAGENGDRTNMEYLENCRPNLWHNHERGQRQQQDCYGLKPMSAIGRTLRMQTAADASGNIRRIRIREVLGYVTHTLLPSVIWLPVVVHDPRPSASSGKSCSTTPRSRCSARCNRDLTVPGSTLSASAVSCTESSRKYRR